MKRLWGEWGTITILLLLVALTVFAWYNQAHESSALAAQTELVEDLV